MVDRRSKHWNSSETVNFTIFLKFSEYKEIQLQVNQRFSLLMINQISDYIPRSVIHNAGGHENHLGSHQ